MAKIERILASVAAKLRADFEGLTREIKHLGARGHAREILLVEGFLKLYLPGTVQVTGNGEVISAGGETSSECDVLVVDPRTPPLLEVSGYRVVPIEYVYGIIEVKSQLSAAALEETLTKVRRTKQIGKSAFMPQEGPVIMSTRLYGREWNYFPLTAFVFAYDSVNLPDLAFAINQAQREVPLPERIDAVWVLNKGFLVNKNSASKQYEATPTPGSLLVPVQSDNPLLTMTLMMQHLFQEAWMSKFRAHDYFAGVNHGTPLPFRID